MCKKSNLEKETLDNFCIRKLFRVGGYKYKKKLNLKVEGGVIKRRKYNIDNR